MSKYNDDDLPHPSVDCTGRFHVDAVLRLHRFRIHKRHKADEPLWWRDGAIWRERDALRTIPPMELRN